MDLFNLWELLLLLFLLIKTTKKEIIKIRNHWKIILFTVLVGVIATILQFFAILNNFVPIMESIKKVSWAIKFSSFWKLLF